MKSLAIFLATMVLLAGCGTRSIGRPEALGMPPKASPAAAPSASTEYFEMTHKGRIWVVGSRASADKLAGGTEPAMAVTRIGYGPNKETVKFEASADGVEKRLVTEYEKRHAKK